jgi:SAM-dependent methyltransferase
MAVRDVFTRIYRTDAWEGDDSRSGPGSGIIPTTHLRPALVELCRELEIRTVIDAACGDGNWMPDLPGYVGVDVSPEAVRLARVRNPHRTYLVGNVATMKLPQADLVIIRDAIQHLSLADGMATLASILRSKPRYLLASTYVGGENVDIVTGADAYSPDLEAAPFSMGEPERLIFDGWTYHDATAVRDPRKFLGLWRLTTT